MGNFINIKKQGKKSQANDSVESSKLFKREWIFSFCSSQLRNIDGEYKNVFNLIQERDLQHLTMRTFDDGAITLEVQGQTLIIV